MSKENIPLYYAVNYESSAPRTYIAVKNPDSDAVEWRSYLGIQEKLISSVIATVGPTTKVGGGPGYEIDHDTYAMLTADVTHVVVANRLIPEKLRKRAGDDTATLPGYDDVVKTVAIHDIPPSTTGIKIPVLQHINLPSTKASKSDDRKEKPPQALASVG